MIKKSKPVKMTDDVHYNLRFMAGASNMKIGEFIGAMVQSLKTRLKKYQEEYGIKDSYEHPDVIIDFILKMDCGEISYDEFHQRMGNISGSKPSPVERRHLRK